MKPRHGFWKRRWLCGTALAGLAGLSGCSQLAPTGLVQTAPAARPASVNQPPSSDHARLAARPAVLQATATLQVPEDLDAPSQPAEIKALPISLDTVLRLAQDQNGKISMAREQLQEAFAGQDLAAKRWLPDLFLGTSYYRHEGGIQDFQGNLIHSSFGSVFAGGELRGQLDPRDVAFQKIEAERQVWQKRGELSKLTSENLLDAASTYVDFLAAKQGEVVARELHKHMHDLFVDAQKLAKVDPGLQVEVTRVQTELRGQEQTIRKLQEGATSAAAKLIYLLGLDPAAELVPIDRRLAPFNLVDDSVPSDALVDRALTSGPGVREMQGLLALIDEIRDKAQGPCRFIPVFQMNLAEGGFGAGPGDSARWDNRFDLALQARWNLTEFLTARERRRIAASKMQQARLGYQELRAKLTLGVQEAREASISGRDQAGFGEAQIKEARETYRLSRDRFKNLIPLKKGASPSEVLLSIGALGRAQFNYLNALRDHDRAQLRLFILTGQVDANHEDGPGCIPAQTAPTCSR
jgi:outer membrane protein TolC